MIDTEEEIEYIFHEPEEKLALAVFYQALADYRFGAKLIDKQGSMKKLRKYIREHPSSNMRSYLRISLVNYRTARRFLDREITLWHDIIGLNLIDLTSIDWFLKKKPKLTEYYRRGDGEGLL